MPKAFISYCTKEKEVGEHLRSLLRTFGDEVFFAGDSIPPGVDFWKYILNKLAESEFFIVALTPAALQSDAVIREIDEALRLKKRIIPLLRGVTPEQLPIQIRHLQAFDVERPDELYRFLNGYGKEVSSSNLGIGIVIGIVVGALLAVLLLRKAAK